MARRLFTVLSALSLLLCVAVALLWVRSYRSSRTVTWQSAEATHTAGMNRGEWRLHVVGRNRPDIRGVPNGHHVLLRRARRPTGQRDVPGLHYRAGYEDLPWAVRSASVLAGPAYRTWRGRFALPTFAAALLPAAWAAHRLHRRRNRRSEAEILCTCCGYDLRATPRSLPGVRDGYCGEGGVICPPARPAAVPPPAAPSATHTTFIPAVSPGSARAVSCPPMARRLFTLLSALSLLGGA